MKKASELIPWKVTDISLRPYKEMWSMNPSIHFDGTLWRCLLRCTDYAMPDGIAIRSSKAQPGESRTRNALVIFDPGTWKPLEIYKVHERDELPRAPCENLGYEDVRIFTTDRGGLQGIAASLHLRRASAMSSQNRIPEQVVLGFNENYDVVAARPLRGTWSDTPQKNWAPFDRCAEPRFLYSIGSGALFDERGELAENAARILPATGVSQRRWRAPDAPTRKRARGRALAAEEARAHVQEREHRRQSRRDKSFDALDREARGLHAGAVSSLGTLRGGTQLCRVAADAWLGVGHEMMLVKKRKYYWHVWYLVDARGRMRAASPSMKFAQSGIEFAAGLAIEGDRVVVSFGVDDMECRLGETRLPEVLAMLRPIEG